MKHQKDDLSQHLKGRETPIYLAKLELIQSTDRVFLGHVTNLPFEQRLDKVYEGVLDVMTTYKPEALSIEQLFYQHNQTTVIGVAEARGVILLAAAKCGIPIFEYTPMQVKQAVTGYGKAVKKQVQEMTRMMLKLEKVPKPDDTADALGMAIAHCHCSRSRLMGTPLR